MKKDAIVDKYLDKHRQLPQFAKEQHSDRTVKFRFCRLCGKRLEAGGEFRAHMNRHE